MIYCPFCKILFNGSQFLSHMKQHHVSQINLECQCPYENCGSKFSKVYGYKKHALSYHEQDNGSEDTSVVENESKSSVDKQNHAIHFDPNSDRINIVDDVIDISNSFINFNERSSINLNAIDSSLLPKNTNSNLQLHNPVNFETEVANRAACLVTDLYKHSTLPQSLIHDIIKSMQQFYNSFVLAELVKKLENDGNVDDLLKMINVLKNAFTNFKTPHMTVKYLKKTSYYLEPIQINLEAYLAPRRIKKTIKTVTKFRSMQIIPMYDTLKRFLELPGVFISILEHIKNVKNNSTLITSIFQGSVWKENERNFDDKLVLPLLVYCDEFEINNPLGTRAGLKKLGAIYYTIPCIPFIFSSKLENIFLFQLYYNHDYSVLGNSITFNEMINQITSLFNNGIDIQVCGQSQRVYFQLSFIIGDNLGVHNILGFQRSFNAHYSCRICIASKEERKNLLVEDSKLLRTITSYNEHSSELSFGIRERCVFNNIPNYHVIHNLCIDPMHDLFEGVFRHKMVIILHALIIKEKYLSLSTFNSRLQYLHHSSDGHTLLPTLTIDVLKCRELKLSASEMAYLMRYLGLIIGDLIPEDNEYYQLYLLLNEIKNVILASAYNTDMPHHLKELVFQYHQSLHRLDISIIVKDHLLTHYPGLLLKIGPLKNVSCMRFEAKHQEMKTIIKNVTSRLNPARTIARRYQIQMCKRFICQEGFTHCLSSGKKNVICINNLKEYNQFQNILPMNFINRQISIVSWVKINSTYYSEGMIICLDNDNLLPSYGKIQYIIIDNSEVFFLFLYLITLRESKHLQAYQLIPSTKWGFINQNVLSMYSPCDIHDSSDGKKYVPFP